MRYIIIILTSAVLSNTSIACIADTTINQSKFFVLKYGVYKPGIAARLTELKTDNTVQYLMEIQLGVSPSNKEWGMYEFKFKNEDSLIFVLNNSNLVYTNLTDSIPFGSYSTGTMVAWTISTVVELDDSSLEKLMNNKMKRIQIISYDRNFKRRVYSRVLRRNLKKFVNN